MVVREKEDERRDGGVTISFAHVTHARARDFLSKPPEFISRWTLVDSKMNHSNTEST